MLLYWALVYSCMSPCRNDFLPKTNDSTPLAYSAVV